MKPVAKKKPTEVTNPKAKQDAKKTAKAINEQISNTTKKTGSTDGKSNKPDGGLIGELERRKFGAKVMSKMSAKASSK